MQTKNLSLAFLTIVLLSTSCKQNEVSLCGESAICDVEAYPNPTEGPVTVDLLSGSKSEIEITVYSVSGQVVFQEAYPVARGQNQISFNLSDQEDGVYIFDIADRRSATRVAKKLVKGRDL